VAAWPRAADVDGLPTSVPARQARRHSHGPTNRARVASSSFYTLAESTPMVYKLMESASKSW
jgi:hypothetical protein